jgi:ketosteroid isomerase-like protein
MSRDSVEEIYERMTRAFFVDRDVDSFVECFHPEAELLLPRNVMEGGSYKGHAGVRQAFADAFEMWDDLRFELHEFHALDDGALALGRGVNVGKGGAPAVEFQTAYLVRVRDGKVTYFRPYQDHREALEAVGLREG